MTGKNVKNNAVVCDNALVVHFDTAKTLVVARFDLDVLKQCTFEVVSREEAFLLLMRDFAAAQQTVAQFTTKADAHQALQAILQALLDHASPSVRKRPHWLIRSAKGLLMFVGLITLLYVLAIALFLRTASVPGPVMPAAQAPAAPEGEPADLDAFISNGGTGSE